MGASERLDCVPSKSKSSFICVTPLWLSCLTFKNNVCLLALFLDPILQCHFLQCKRSIRGKRMLRITRKNSDNMESHGRCNHVAVPTRFQTKGSLFHLRF